MITSNPIIGTGLHALGGISAAVCYTPYQGIKKWSWGTFWIVQSFFAWLCVPAIIGWLTVPDFFGVLLDAPRNAFWGAFILGAVYGFGGMSFGLAIKHIGYSLTYTIAIGISAVVGTLIPLIVFGGIVSKFTRPGGGIVLTGMIISILGVVLCGLAGFRKEKDLKAGQQEDPNFKMMTGLTLAIIAGVLSGIFNVSLEYGQPIADLAAERGAAHFEGNAKLIVSTAGCFFVNITWFIIAGMRQGTLRELAPREGITSSQFARNYLFCVLTGTFWSMQFFFYGLGHVKMGEFGYASWVIHMSMLVFFSYLVGVIMKEWKSVSRKTYSTLIIALAILIVSFIITTYGSVIGEKAVAGSGISQTDPSPMAKEIRAWRELKYGVFIHFGMSTFDGVELSDGTTPVQEYNPTDLDVDQWIRVAKEAGMKYAVLTAKHVAGFCLWDSKVQWKGKEFAYDVAAGPVKTDVVAAFMEACNKHGIMPGIYYCTMDRRHSHQNIEWTPRLPYLTEEYFQLMQDHLTELHTKYPEIAIQWLDIPRHLTYDQRDTLYKLIRTLNPECLVMYNYGTESRDISGDYTIEVAMKVTWPTDILNSEVTPIKQPFRLHQEYKGKTYELGYEHCVSLVDRWFWTEGSRPKPLDELAEIWDKISRLNGNLLLNVPPDKTGQIPEASVQRLKELYRYMEK